MFIEHTHLHVQQIDGEGEFLLLQLLLAGAEDNCGLRLENLTETPWETLEKERWESMERGAFGVLREKGLQNAVIAVLAVRFLDVDSPPWLFEDVTRSCIRSALADPDTKFTESGQERSLRRYKERNRDALEYLGAI
ncbi:MAG: hypothetical protein ACE369_12165 [Roseovarius sp.]